jgi:K+-sensing histidine kinase KdpD
MRRLRKLAVDPFADFAIAGQLVHTPGEIGEVSDALDAVAGACLQLARQQTELRTSISEAFANLARRNQGCVNAMLSRLDHWERNEQDPDVLGRLFVLDQLATRMRRTVDSLFVIAGVQGPPSQREPSTVDDVVLAALSEIEQFKRVRRSSAGDARVAGWAVVDLVHLLAELFDNATRFTPALASPGVVDLVFRPAADGLVIVIGDHGKGMEPADIDGANALMSAQAVELIFSSMRTMGLLVVAHLAAKHGIAVRFRPRPAQEPGVIVEVHLPETMVLSTRGPRALERSHQPMVVPPAIARRPRFRFSCHRTPSTAGDSRTPCCQSA